MKRPGKKTGRARRASDSAKLAAVTEYNTTEGAKLKDVASRYGVSLMTMSRWVKEARMTGAQEAKRTQGRPLLASEPEESEVQRLRAENAELRRKLYKAMEQLLEARP